MDIPPWVTAGLALATPVCIALWQAYVFLTKRSDDRDSRRDAQEDKHIELLNKQREQLASENAQVYGAMRGELMRKTEALEACEAHRSEGWDAARFWHANAWTMLGRAANARQVAESTVILARNRGVDLPPLTWPDGPLDLPPFDQPRPVRLDLPPPKEPSR